MHVPMDRRTVTNLKTIDQVWIRGAIYSLVLEGPR